MFETAREKLRRASHHLDQLESEIGKYVAASNTHTVTRYLDTDSGHTFGEIRTPNLPLSDDWPLMIGDFLNNLRSALEYVAYVLNGEIKESAFPVFNRKYLFEQLRRKGPDAGKPTPQSGLYKIQGIPLDSNARRVIEAVQPYNAWQFGRDPDAEPLWILHQLNNIDKHRTLHLFRRDLREFVIQARDIVGGDISVEEGAESVSAFGGDEGEVEMDISFAFDVAFDESEVAAVNRRGVRSVCRTLLDEVTWVINAIESVV